MLTNNTGQRRLQHLLDRAPHRREVRRAHRRGPRLLRRRARYEGPQLPRAEGNRRTLSLVKGGFCWGGVF